MQLMKHDYYDQLYRAKRDSGAQGWLTPEGDREVLVLAQRLLAAAGVSGGSLLELGCGAGNMTLALEALGYEVQGIDASSSAVTWAKEQARARHSRALFHLGNVADLAVEIDSSFDVILDGLCFHCITGRNRARCLRGIMERLSPGGVFLLMTMCNDPIVAGLRATFDPDTRMVGSGEVYLGLAASIEYELLQAGFTLSWKKLILGDPDQADQDLLLAVCRL